MADERMNATNKKKKKRETRKQAKKKNRRSRCRCLTWKMMNDNLKCQTTTMWPCELDWQATNMSSDLSIDIAWTWNDCMSFCFIRV